GGWLGGGGIEGCVMKKVHVAHREPASGKCLLEQTLSGEARLKGEPPARLQRATDGSKKVAIPRLAEVGKTVAETERVVEVIVPGQVAHIPLLKSRAQVFLACRPSRVPQKVFA